MKQPKILLVEDDLDDVFFFRRALPEGCELIVAYDGEQGIEKAESERPDLIFLDLMLPKYSGEEVCKAIREHKNKDIAAIPIVVVSAKSSEVDQLIAKVIGANSYISKPYKNDDIQRAASALLPFHTVAQQKKKGSCRILIIEDDRDDVSLVKVMLSRDAKHTYDIESADRLAEGIGLLKKHKPDLIITDLGLPDSQGIQTLQQLMSVSDGVPVVVLSGYEDDRLAEQTVINGAQEFIKKKEMNSANFVRAVHYAIDRNLVVEKARRLAVTDGLTGLHNRFGFQLLAAQQLGFSKKCGKKSFIFYADFDDLKIINDVYGHEKGDAALVSAARILRETFPEPDILARIEGDEFAALLGDYRKEDVEAAAERLTQNLQRFNDQAKFPFSISLTSGVSPVRPEQAKDIDRLLSDSGRILYDAKKHSGPK